MPTRQEHAKVKQDMPHTLKGFGTNQTCSRQVMQQKNSHASLCMVKHHMAPTGQTLQVNFTSASARALPSGCPACKTNSPGAPLGRDTVSRAVGHPATAKTTAYKLGMWCTHRPSTGNYVTATHQEEVATAALRLGKDAPREAAQIPQPPRPG